MRHHTRVPRWAQKRTEKRAEGWGQQRVLLAYPLSRAVFAVVFVVLPLAGLVFVAAPLAIIAAAGSAAQVGVGVGLMVLMAVLYGGVSLLVADAFRTSLLATPWGVELRQPFFRTRALRWEEIHRVEVRTHGYWTGSSEFVLTTGERILSKATDPRRAFYNGYRLRDFRGPGGVALSPTTAELVRLHRAWLDGQLA